MRRLAAVLLAILLSISIPIGAVLGLAAWGVPLASAHVQYGLRPTAESLAAIMGFTEPTIPVALTCVVGMLLGLSGAWLGSAVRSLAAGQPATSR